MPRYSCATPKPRTASAFQSETNWICSRSSAWLHAVCVQHESRDTAKRVTPWNGDAVRGFEVVHEFRGMKDVAERTAFLVERGGTVRRAWRYDTGEVPDFDELLAAARAM